MIESLFMIKQCSYCHEMSVDNLLTTDINQNISDEVFIYEYCRKCKATVLLSVPDDLSKYYPSNYHYVPSTVQEIENFSHHESYKIDLIKRFIDSGSLLEIGSSNGSFAFLAKKNGFDVNAVEMNERCCDFLNNVLKIKTFQSFDTLATLREIKKSYDVIVFWHVIEHLSNPFEVLETCTKLLTSNGILVIAAPNPSSLQFKIFKEKWVHLDAPRHITLIPISELSSRCQSYGLIPEFITTRDPGGISWNLFGWRFSLSNMTNKKISQKVLNKIGRILFTIFYPIEIYSCLGATYTIIFRRKVN